MVAAKKSTRKHRISVHRPVVDGKVKRKEQLLDDTKSVIAHILDQRGPKGWRNDILLCARFDKVIEDEIDLHIAGISSMAQLGKALAIRNVAAKAGYVPHRLI